MNPGLPRCLVQRPIVRKVVLVVNGKDEVVDTVCAEVVPVVELQADQERVHLQVGISSCEWGLQWGVTIIGTRVLF